MAVEMLKMQSTLLPLPHAIAPTVSKMTPMQSGFMKDSAAVNNTVSAHMRAVTNGVAAPAVTALVLLARGRLLVHEPCSPAAAPGRVVIVFRRLLNGSMPGLFHGFGKRNAAIGCLGEIT